MMNIGAKLAVAPVARATPLFLPRPEIIYINVVHYSAPPRTYLLRATPLFRPLWRHCVYVNNVPNTSKIIFASWILILSMINGANRGIKAVLHVVNKFGAGQNNVAHLCI